MNELEKYNDQIPRGEIVNLETLQESGGELFRFVTGILRRWYIVLLVLIVICGLGLPAVWLLKKPVQVVKGSIRIAPIMEDILTDKKDSGQISNYEIFMNTQAQVLTSNQVIQRVADDLAGKNLSFFEQMPTDLMTKIKEQFFGEKTLRPEPAWQLKQAVMGKKITIIAPPDTELIQITMRSNKPEEAKQIVDAFIKAYMAIGVSSSTAEEDKTLAILENEMKIRVDEMSGLRQQIYRKAQEYGTDTLSGRQDMMLRRVAELLSKLTQVEAEKVNLEAKVQLLERTNEQYIPPDELLKMRQTFINNDTSVTVLSNNIAKMEQELIILQETTTGSNPNLELQGKLVEIMKTHLEEAKEQAGNKFNENLNEEMARAGDATLLSTRAALEQTTAYAELLQGTIDKEDKETIALGRLQLEIEDLRDRLTMAKDRYETVLKRTQSLEMQNKRPARISVADYASIADTEDKRIKFSAAIIAAGLFCGLWLAFLRDKADLRMRTPEDIVKRTGIRIIGTTTSLDDIKPKHVKDYIIGDYQTIRANLELLGTEGIPKKLVVTSPGMKEGKTTFAVNLAMNMAEAGKKVLLIDGDLRKPDVARLLNLPKNTRGLQDVMSGIRFDRAVHSVVSTGLDVLAADFRDAADACELLSLPSTAQQINKISEHYDNVIIDTPPVLAFPDALIWAKMGDAVILTSFAGHTTVPEMREAKDRLNQINAKILGTVVSSVEAEHSYYRPSYGTYAQIGRKGIVRKIIASENAQTEQN